MKGKKDFGSASKPVSDSPSSSTAPVSDVFTIFSAMQFEDRRRSEEERRRREEQDRRQRIEEEKRDVLREKKKEDVVMIFSLLY